MKLSRILCLGAIVTSLYLGAGCMVPPTTSEQGTAQPDAVFVHPGVVDVTLRQPYNMQDYCYNAGQLINAKRYQEAQQWIDGGIQFAQNQTDGSATLDTYCTEDSPSVARYKLETLRAKIPQEEIDARSQANEVEMPEGQMEPIKGVENMSIDKLTGEIYAVNSAQPHLGIVVARAAPEGYYDGVVTMNGIAQYIFNVQGIDGALHDLVVVKTEPNGYYEGFEYYPEFGTQGITGLPVLPLAEASVPAGVFSEFFIPFPYGHLVPVPVGP
ncbi:hypothetical protein JXB41_06350 [Candidatus Woesearchaeota archaeon]|nr:hypothetical protein [Candidatus Woesearchaeota archaeon]